MVYDGQIWTNMDNPKKQKMDGWFDMVKTPKKMDGFMFVLSGGLVKIQKIDGWFMMVSQNK